MICRRRGVGGEGRVGAHFHQKFPHKARARGRRRRGLNNKRDNVAEEEDGCDSPTSNFVFSPNRLFYHLGGSVGEDVDQGEGLERTWGKKGRNAVVEGNGDGDGRGGGDWRRGRKSGCFGRGGKG